MIRYASAIITALLLPFPCLAQGFDPASTPLTYTNKTFDTASSGNVFKINGTSISSVTGSGAAVLGTNPLLSGPTFSGAAAPSTNAGASLGTTSSAWATSYIENIYSDGNLQLGAANTAYWRITSTGQLFAVSSTSQTFGWGTGGTIDTGFTRLGTASVGLGTGASGDVSGNLSLATLTVSGHSGFDGQTAASNGSSFGNVYVCAVCSLLFGVGGANVGSISMPANGVFAFVDTSGKIASIRRTYTVGTLPMVPTTGAEAYVSDQLTSCPATGSAPTGGGSVLCPVYYNGSSWVGG